MSYITFEFLGTSDSGKTSRFEVRARSNSAIIGWIYWYPAWRKYIFHPNGLFDEGCLREIADFVEKQTIEHRNTGGKHVLRDAVAE